MRKGILIRLSDVLPPEILSALEKRAADPAQAPDTFNPAKKFRPPEEKKPPAPLRTSSVVPAGQVPSSQPVVPVGPSPEQTRRESAQQQMATRVDPARVGGAGIQPEYRAPIETAKPGLIDRMTRGSGLNILERANAPVRDFSRDFFAPGVVAGVPIWDTSPTADTSVMGRLGNVVANIPGPGHLARGFATKGSFGGAPVMALTRAAGGEVSQNEIDRSAQAYAAKPPLDKLKSMGETTLNTLSAGATVAPVAKALVPAGQAIFRSAVEAGKGAYDVGRGVVRAAQDLGEGAARGLQGLTPQPAYAMIAPRAIAQRSATSATWNPRSGNVMPTSAMRGPVEPPVWARRPATVPPDSAARPPAKEVPSSEVLRREAIDAAKKEAVKSPDPAETPVAAAARQERLAAQAKARAEGRGTQLGLKTYEELRQAEAAKAKATAGTPPAEAALGPAAGNVAPGAATAATAEQAPSAFTRAREVLKGVRDKLKPAEHVVETKQLQGAVKELGKRAKPIEDINDWAVVKSGPAAQGTSEARATWMTNPVSGETGWVVSTGKGNAFLGNKSLPPDWERALPYSQRASAAEASAAARKASIAEARAAEASAAARKASIAEARARARRANIAEASAAEARAAEARAPAAKSVPAEAPASAPAAGEGLWAKTKKWGGRAATAGTMGYAGHVVNEGARDLTGKSLVDRAQEWITGKDVTPPGGAKGAASNEATRIYSGPAKAKDQQQVGVYGGEVVPPVEGKAPAAGEPKASPQTSASAPASTERVTYAPELQEFFAKADVPEGRKAALQAAFTRDPEAAKRRMKSILEGK